MDDLNSSSPNRLRAPSAEPSPPTDMRVSDERWVEPTILPQPGDSRFFIMKQGLRRPRASGTGRWIDDPYKRIDSIDVGSASQPLHWVSDKPRPKQLDDLLGGPPWTMSRRLLELVLSVESFDAIKYWPIHASFSDGVIENQQFIVVTARMIPAVDYANSRVRYVKHEGYPAIPIQFGPASLMPDIPDRYHVFGDKAALGKTFVSTLLKERIESLRPPPFNIAFYDPAEPHLTF